MMRSQYYNFLVSDIYGSHTYAAYIFQIFCIITGFVGATRLGSLRVCTIIIASTKENVTYDTTAVKNQISLLIRGV